MRSLPLASLAACAAWLLASALAAAAAEPGAMPRTDGNPIPRVDLAIVGGHAASAEALGSRVLSWFRDETTRTHATRVSTLEASTVFAPSAVAGVRVWIFTPTPTTVRLLFAVQEAPGDAPRFLTDDITLDSGLDEVGKEQLAQIVYLSALALWAGNVESTQKEVEEQLALSLKQPAAPPPDKAPEPTPSKKPRGPALRGGVEYALRSRGDEGLAHSPGALVAVAWPLGRFELGGLIHAGYALPRSTDSGVLLLDLVGADVRAGVASAWRASSRAWITGELGPGLDVVHYEASFSDLAVQPSESRTDFRPFLYAALGVRGDLGMASVAVSAILAVQLQRTHYDIDAESERTALLVSAIVQPGFSASVLW